MVTIGPVWSSGKPARYSGPMPRSVAASNGARQKVAYASHRPVWTMPGRMAQRS